MVFLPVPYAQSQGPWIYKYQEKFYFCRDLLKGKKEHPKKIPQSDALLTEDSPCARRMEPLPPQTGDRGVELPFLWAFVLGACLLVPPGSLWDQQTTTPKVPTVQCSECARVCVCARLCKTTFFPSEERDLGCWLCPGWAVGGRPLPGAGGQVPSLVLLLADLRRNKMGSEKLAGMCLCLGGRCFLHTPQPLFFTQAGHI